MELGQPQAGRGFPGDRIRGDNQALAAHHAYVRVSEPMCDWSAASLKTNGQRSFEVLS